MNPLAVELNEILKGCCAEKLLSDMGTRFYFPSKGIVSQSAEAKKKAHKYNATIGMAVAEGKPILLPSVGKFINELSPAEVVAYAPTQGDPELRELWKKQIGKKNPSVNTDKISHPIVVPGLTTGISQIADLFMDEGDCVVIPDMFWGNYRLIFDGKRKANIVPFPFFEESGSLNTTGFKTAIMENAKNNKAIVMVNFPNNPAGYSPTKKEAAEIAAALKECAEAGINILAVTDDAYFGLFYDDDTNTESLFGELAELHDNILAVKVDGCTKEDFVWGFRIGFVTFGSKGLNTEQYKALEMKLMGNLRATISNSNRMAQSILIKALQDPNYESEKQHWAKVLKSRYKKVRAIVDSTDKGKALKALPFNSGYFMSFVCNGISAEDLRLKLLEKGIGTISIQEKYLRIAFASVDEENLEDLYNTVFETADELV